MKTVEEKERLMGRYVSKARALKGQVNVVTSDPTIRTVLLPNGKVKKVLNSRMAARALKAAVKIN